MRCQLIPNFRALILRRTMPELRSSHLIDIEREAKLLGEHYTTSPSPLVRFRNGSRLMFAHCETNADILNFLSSQYGFIGFDELSTFLLDQFLMISAAARTTLNAGYQAVVRAGSNTLGPGSAWMKDWFVDHTVRLEDYPDYNPDDFEMQFSTLEMNKSVDAKAYARRLRNQPDHVRRSWLLGEFIMEGAYFADFWPTKLIEGSGQKQPWHVIPDLPTLNGRPLFQHSWLSVFRCIDWGFDPDPAVCLWIAVLPNKRAIVFKERTWRRTLAGEVARQIREESVGMNVCETFCDPTMMIKEGQTYSIGELFEQNGVPLTPSMNKRDLAGYAVHNYLNTLIDEQPQLQIVQPLGPYGCPNLIRTFPILRMDPNDQTKIGNGDDHWVIALAYFAMGGAAPSHDPARPAVPRWMQPHKKLTASMVG